MPDPVTVIAGPARSGKTAMVLAGYRKALARRRPGSTLWLAPTWRAVADVRGRLLDGGLEGCLGPGVMTFEQFAEVVLAFAPQPIRPLGRLMKRHLVRRLLDRQNQAGRLRHFGPIAQTGGLLDLVDQWISELKRLEIWPEHFRQACAARGMTAKDQELLEIYEAYQDCLNEHHLYDAEGRFWSARTLLEQGQRRPLERLELVVVDGFADFTRTQHEILDVLAGRVKELLVTLPWEADSHRADLFARPRKTLDQLRSRHPQLALHAISRPPKPDWPAMAHIEAALFGDPRRARAAESTAGIEILAASRELGEIERIGARIKGLLTTGCEESGGRRVGPGDVAVVFRSLAGADALVREVFGRLGIPVWLESGRSLEQSTALRALVGLLQLDARDWPLRDLLAVLSSSYFQPDWPEWHEGRAVAAADRAVRHLQVPRGCAKLIERVGRLAQQPLPEDPDEQGPAQRRAEGARLALPLLQRLRQVLDDLPRRATLAGWAAAWQRLADQTGLLRVIRETPRADFPDLLAWERLQEALLVARRLSEWMGEEGDTLSRSRERVAAQRPGEGTAGGEGDAGDAKPQSQVSPPSPPAPLPKGEGRFADPLLDRREALAALLDTLAHVQIPDSCDQAACVRVLTARSVRGLRVPYLFLAGLSEKAFPPPDGEDRLYGEAESQRLIDEGLPLVARGERSRDEMLLFYEAVTRATRRLHLSYPALDEAAQPLSPSPYLQEVEQACGVGRVWRINAADLSPVPTSDQPLSDVDFRVKAVATALEGNVALLAGLVRESLPLPTGEGRGEGGLTEQGTRPHPQPLSRKRARGATGPHPSPLPEGEGTIVENILAGLRLVDQRQGRDGFGPAEGMLAGEAVRAELASRFAPDRTFSATELERYASCPFHFYLETVLGLEPPEDLTLAVDYLTRGRLAHSALAALHAEINRACGRPASPAALPPGEYERLLRETLEQVLARPVGHPVEAALREVDRRLLEGWLSDYLGQHREYDALCQQWDVPPAPAHFEVSFGRSTSRAKDRSKDRLQTSEVLETSEVSPFPAIEQPLEVTFGGRTVRLSGRIDRIDIGQIAGRTVFNVVDYKTGGSTRFSPEAVAAGTALQLPVYALAVERLLLAGPDAAGWLAGYWYLKESGFKVRSALKMHRQEEDRLVPEAQWEEIRRVVAETLVVLVEGIRRAEFPVASADEQCTRNCPYSTACRIHQVRSLEKTWTPVLPQE